MLCIRFLSTAVLLVLPAACLPAAIPVYPAVPTHERIFSYSYENLQRASIGSPMVYRVDGRVGEGYATTVSYQPEPEEGGELHFSRIETGVDWYVVGRTRTGDYICESAAYPRPIRHDERVPWDFCLVVNEAGEPYGYAHCRTGEIVVRPWQKKPFNFLKKYARVFYAGTFRQEIVYASRLHEKITLVYREYRDDLKRPSFEQSYVFDLAQSRTIGIRGMRMEIVEATPEQIRFFVRAPFEETTP